MKKNNSVIFFGFILFLGITAFSQAVTIGETGAGSSALIDPLDYFTLTQFSSPANGTINRIHVRMDITSGEGRVAIYANAGPDQPGVLLAQSASKPLVLHWNTFVIPSTPVSAGATYWLTVQVDNNTAAINIFGGDPNPNKMAYSAGLTYGDFPADLSAILPGGYLNWRMSIYTSDSATPTRTVTVTATVTPTLTISPTVTPTPTITLTPTITPTVTTTTTATPSATVTETSQPVKTATATMTATQNLRTLALDKIQIYPQPAGELVYVAYAFTGQGSVVMNLYNSNAEHVLKVEESPHLQGKVAVTQLQTQTISPGIYYLLISIDDDSGKRQIKKSLAIVR